MICKHFENIFKDQITPNERSVNITARNLSKNFARVLEYFLLTRLSHIKCHMYSASHQVALASEV